MLALKLEDPLVIFVFGTVHDHGMLGYLSCFWLSLCLLLSGLQLASVYFGDFTNLDFMS